MMKSKEFIVHLFFFFLCSGNLLALQSENPPNFLFIIADDLNDYLGAYGGHPQAITPNIDKLADSAVRFKNAQSNVPVCSPSRNSFITGVYPHTSKDYGWTDLKKQPVLKNNKTIIRYLSENGYLTLGTGKITHGSIRNDWDEWGLPLKNNYGPIYNDGENNTSNPSVPAPFSSIGGIDGSYGRLSVVTSPGIVGEPGWVYGWDKQPMRYFSDDNRDFTQDELHADWAIQKIKDLEALDTPQPFFMGIGFIRPHTPLHAPDKYFDMFPIEDLELDDWQLNDLKDTFYSQNFENENKDNKGPRYYKLLLESYDGNHDLAMKHFLQAYLACIAFLDDQVGKVLDALDKSKFKDNTIVIFTSDHGWQMGEKEYLFKNSPWEESTRIPLIIRTPESTAGRSVTHPVSLIDLFPTIVDYGNLSGDHKFNDQAGDIGGYSLRPFLEGKPENWEGPNGALSIVGNYGLTIPTEKQIFSYRTERWRYIRYGDGNVELYDHMSDPYEWANLASDTSYTNIIKALNTEMQLIIDTNQ